LASTSRPWSNKGEHSESKANWCSAETREQLRRYITRERSKLDPQHRTRLEDLQDAAPIFLSRRRCQLGYSGFGTIFKRLLEALVDDLGWRSAEMLKTYDHAITKAEMKELMASSVRQRLEDAPHDSASLQALLAARKQQVTPTDAEPRREVHSLSDDARQTLAWIDELVDA
jgi:hypothetical protein